MSGGDVRGSKRRGRTCRIDSHVSYHLRQLDRATGMCQRWQTTRNTATRRLIGIQCVWSKNLKCRRGNAGKVCGDRARPAMRSRTGSYCDWIDDSHRNPFCPFPGRSRDHKWRRDYSGPKIWICRRSVANIQEAWCLTLKASQEIHLTSFD